MAISRFATSTLKQGLPKYTELWDGSTLYPPPGYESIATVVGTGSAATITFDNIPATYKHLQIRWSARTALTGSNRQELQLRFNNSSTAVYDYHGLYGDGASVNASAEVSTSGSFGLVGWTTTNNVASDIMGVGLVDIHDYADTSKNTTVRSFSGHDLNGSGRALLISTGWRNTAAITRIDLIAGNNFTTASVFELYGIRSI